MIGHCAVLLLACFWLRNVEAQVTIEIKPLYPGHGNSLQMLCNTAAVPTFDDVLQLTFFSDDAARKIVYKLTRDCDTKTVNATEDTTNGRITWMKDGSVGATIRDLEYGDDDAAFKCAVAACPSSALVESTNAVNFTIVRTPVTPAFTTPTAKEVRFYDGVMTRSEFVCDGDAGLPGGRMDLEIAQYYTNGTAHLTPLVSTDTNDAGIAKISFNFTTSYPKTTKLEEFRCRTYNYLNTNLLARVARLSIVVDYKPEEVVFVSRSSEVSLVKFNSTQYYLTASVPLDVEVACQADAVPAAKRMFTQLSGPTWPVEPISGGSSVSIQYTEKEDITLVLRCDANYTSKALPEVATAMSSYLTVFVKGSGEVTSILTSTPAAFQSTQTSGSHVAASISALLTVIALISNRII